MRIYFCKRGAHIHCRVFTNGKNGDLVFDEREWPDIYTKLTRIADVKDELTPPGEGPFPTGHESRLDTQNG